MARRSEHSQEEIREMILVAAEIIVREEGFSELKVRKVAMEVDYTVGTIYMVFDNLDDLIMHVKARTLDKLAHHLEVTVSGESPEIQLVELAKAYLAFAISNFELWNMIFIHRLPGTNSIPQWYQTRVENLFQPVERLFKALAPDKAVNDIEKAARALWGGIHGICFLSLTGKLDVAGIHDVEECIILQVESFVRGWAGKGA